MHRTYLRLQQKRAFKIYPEIFLVTLISVLAIVVTLVSMLVTNMQSDDKKKVSIGIVGNTDDPYISVGVEAIKNYDSSRFYLEVLQFNEKEAREALQKREISGYLYIPDGYVKNIFKGKNNPAKYITPKTPDGFGSIVAGEVADIASYVVTESQAGMYSMQRVSDDFDLPGKSKNFNKLMLSYVNVILARSDVVDVEELGLLDELSTGGYYIAGMIIFLLLLWGISCSKLFNSRKLSLSSVLKASNMQVERQIFCEYLSFLTITVLTMLLFAVLSGIVISFNNFGIRELSGEGLMSSILFVVRILPAVMLVTIMQSFVYEIIPGETGSVLALFLISVGLGYLSGCFYPNYFFPDTVEKIAAILPVGVGFKYVREALIYDISPGTFLMTLIYIAVFSVLTVYIRKRRIEGDGV